MERRKGQYSEPKQNFCESHCRQRHSRRSYDKGSFRQALDTVPVYPRRRYMSRKVRTSSPVRSQPSC